MSEAQTAEVPEAPEMPAGVPFPGQPVDPNAALAGAIVTAVNAAQGPKKIGVARYLRERSVHRGKPFLARKTMQNGFQLSEDALSRDAILMANELKPGVYCNGTFRVVAAQDGTSMSGIDIQYSNKSIDQRFTLKSNYPTFEHMLAAILKEQEAVAAS
jgi:hypothetical protein